jgi:Flp pilus assembly pilin Flp
MKRLEGWSLKLGIWVHGLARNVKGQDLIEYAMMAGFVAVAAAALMPNINTSLSTVFSKVKSVMILAAAS